MASWESLMARSKPGPIVATPSWSAFPETSSSARPNSSRRWATWTARLVAGWRLEMSFRLKLRAGLAGSVHATDELSQPRRMSSAVVGVGKLAA